MKNKLSPPVKSANICVIGENAKAIAATMALTSFSISVDLYTLSSSSDNFVQRYAFDTPLCEQWQTSIDLSLIDHYVLDCDVLAEKNYDTYWIFLDQLSDERQHSLINDLADFDKTIIFSGITGIGHIDDLSAQLQTRYVFYIPFVFLNQASVFLATINPRLLLVGEKTANTAVYHPIIKLFIEQSYRHSIETLKTVEFARSSMMNLVSSKLSLVNEMARLADCCGVDMQDVEAILNLDERLGKGFLKSGWGYGGSTLPKENKLLSEELKNAKLSTNLINEVSRINEDQKELIFRKLWRYFDSYIQSKTIVIWGAGYKPGTGRTKGSAIHTLLPLLWAHDIITLVFDPLAKNELNQIYKTNGQLRFIENPKHIWHDVDALIILNGLRDYYPDVNVLNKYKIPVFDAKNLLNKSEIQQLETYYTGIGRGIV